VTIDTADNIFSTFLVTFFCFNKPASLMLL